MQLKARLTICQSHSIDRYQVIRADLKPERHTDHRTRVISAQKKREVEENRSLVGRTQSRTSKGAIPFIMNNESLEEDIV